MELFLLPVLVFLTVLLVALVFARRHEQSSQEQTILARISPPAVEEVEEVAIMRPTRLRESGFIDTLLLKFHLIQRLEETLWQAGLYIKATDALVVMVVLGVAGGAAGAVWNGELGLPAFGLAAMMAMLPLAYITWRRRRRLRAFDQQLPEVLDMLKSSLDAGHTLQRAMQVTVEEFGEPASGELRIVLEQNRLGVPLARALEYMLQRIPDENLRFLVVAVQIQSEVGSSLAGIISQLARTIRDRHRVDMTVRVLTAQPRISGLIGGLMPIILLIALYFIQPENVRILFHDPTGFRLVKIAAVLEVLAFATIYRLVGVDY
jgi:tight adherence protein B